MYKLLIADDELLEREAVKFIIAEHFLGHFEVYEAVNGREAIEKALTIKPEVMLFDIKMPGINGLEAAARIRKEIPESRLIIVSAYQYFSYAKEALSLGADEYLTKPVSVKQTIETLQKTLKLIEAEKAERFRQDCTAKTLSQLIQYLKKELIVLIASGFIEDAVFQEYFNILEIKYNRLVCAVGSIVEGQFKLEFQIEQQNILRQIAEKITLCFDQAGYFTCTGTIGTEIYTLVLMNDDLSEFDSRVHCQEVFSEIKDEVSRTLNIYLNIGIGNNYDILQEVSSSLLQAKMALNYDLTPGTITCYADIHQGVSPVYPIFKENRLAEVIIQGEVDISQQIMDELLDWLFTNLPGLVMRQRKIFELLAVITRNIITATNLSELDIDTEGLRKAINMLNDEHELRLFTKNWIAAKINELSKVRKSRSRTLLELVLRYLEESYSRDISLDEVAEFVQITPYYLSKLFKKETGQNFIDYLTTLRVSHAKKMLTDPLRSVKEVSFQVGYHDPNYFARVFKKACGITPTEFKVLHSSVN